MSETHEHRWEAAEVYCPDLDCSLINNDGLPHASHPAVACEGCGGVVDLIREEDPR